MSYMLFIFTEKFVEETALHAKLKNQLNMLQSNKTQVSLGAFKIMAKMK